MNFLEGWKRWDGFLGEEVELILGDTRINGTHAGLVEMGSGQWGQAGGLARPGVAEHRFPGPSR